MNIENLSWTENKFKRQNSPLLPKSIRGLIVGKSGCGKTTLLMNLLLRPGWLDYNKLFIFGKSLHQPEYRILKSALEKGLSKDIILKLFENHKEIEKLGSEKVMDSLSSNSATMEGQFYESASDIPDPKDLNPHDKNLIIFDDVLLQKQNKCEAYYTRGRHNNVDCFYLSQNYFRLPRQTIRENANFICLFRQDLRNINQIYNDHINEITIEEFRKLCKKSWDSKYGFMVIDLSSNATEGKFRIGFDNFYIPTIND